MRASAMQRVDRWLGLRFCLALTALRPLVDRSRQPEDPVRRIVLIKLAEQGSTVLASSAIRRAVDLVGRPNTFFPGFEENRSSWTSWI